MKNEKNKMAEEEKTTNEEEFIEEINDAQERLN